MLEPSNYNHKTFLLLLDPEFKGMSEIQIDLFHVLYSQIHFLPNTGIRILRSIRFHSPLETKMLKLYRF